MDPFAPQHQPRRDHDGAIELALLRQRAAVMKCEYLLGQLAAIEADLIDAYALAGHSAVRVGEAIGGDVAVTHAYRAVAEELGAVARVAGRTMEARISDAQAQQPYRQVIEALGRGEIHLGHARVIADEGTIIDEPERQKQYEVAVLELARSQSSNRLRPHARRLAEEFTEISLVQREEAAAKQRCVYVRELPDGMARLELEAPAAQVLAVRDRLRQMGRQQQRANRQVTREALTRGSAEHEFDDRSIAMLQADIALDLLLAAAPEAHSGADPSVRGSIRVVVPAFGLLDDAEADRLRQLPELQELCGLRGSPHLADYGPVSDEIAKLVARESTDWEHATVHPLTGELLHVQTYTPSVAQTRFVAARDLHCRFPGCRHPVTISELDHTTEWANGGATNVGNLGFLCTRHHTLKHHLLNDAYRWKVTQRSGGTLLWESPMGRQYTDRPPSGVMFMPANSPGLGGRRNRGETSREASASEGDDGNLPNNESQAPF